MRLDVGPGWPHQGHGVVGGLALVLRRLPGAAGTWNFPDPKPFTEAMGLRELHGSHHKNPISMGLKLGSIGS